MNTGGFEKKPNPLPGEKAAEGAGFDEPWAALHNFQLWHTDPDGTYSWRNDATGFSYGE